MKSFGTFILESKIKKMPYERFPKIGWWEDNKILTLYHGTHVSNIEYIEKNGLISPKDGYTAGIVSLALEPNTSWGYASMSGTGGEAASIRNAGAKAKTTPKKERVVFVIEMPLAYVKKHILNINYDTSKDKLTKRELFDVWNNSDQEYYALTELKLKVPVDPKYIKGYMTK